MQKFVISTSLFFLLGMKLFSQVNIQSGSAEFQLPIYNFSDAQSGLTHQVFLNYSSGNGLRVNDIPSSMGQGWELVCGGSIVREQRGEPDDQSSQPLFPTFPYNNIGGYNQSIAVAAEQTQTATNYINNYYPNGFLYSEFPLTLTEDFPLNAAAPRELCFIPRFRNSMAKEWKSSRRSLTDRQQDVFIFNFNGRMGEFVIGKNGQIVTLNDSKLKIEKWEDNLLSSNIRTRIYKFRITDESGIIYEFAAMSLAEVLNAKEISNSGGDFSFSTTSGDPTGQYTVDQWSLTAIINPFTNEQITFDYDDVDVDFIAHRIPSYLYMEVNNKENVNIHQDRSKGKIKRLKTITFPEGHSVEINYDANWRQDISNIPRVDNVVVKYSGNQIYRFVFTHSYLFKKQVRSYTESFAEADKRFLRLCLTSVQKIGADGTSEPPYQFTYNTGIESNDPSDIVPSTDCFAQDHWGYYNKSSIVDINIAIPAKETFKSLMSDVSTTRIVSPSTAKFGLLKSIKNPMTGEISYEYAQNTQTVTTGGQTQVINTGGVHISSVKQYDGIDHNNDIVTNYGYVLEDGSSSLWGYEEPIYNINKEVKIYKDVYHYNYGGVLVQDLTGTLMKAIAKTVVKMIVKQILKKAVEGAGGFAIGIAISITMDAIFYFADPFDYEHSHNYQFYPLNYSNTIGTHTSRVEITNSSIPGGVGKVIQEFSRPANITTEILSNDFPYSYKQRYTGWEFDNIKKEIITNTANQPVSENNYNYNVVKNTLNTSDFLSCKIETNYLRSARCEAASYNFPISDLSPDFYYPMTGRTEMTSFTQKKYGNSGTIAETNTSVSYNADFLPKSKTITKSNGDQIISRYYYANDYDNSVSAAIALLKQKNAFAVPVSTETWLKKSGTNDEFLIDAMVNEYSILSNGAVKISKIYKLESKQPIPFSSILYQNPFQLIRNSQYFIQQEEYSYNSDGNLIEQTSKGGDISSTMYGYNKRLPIAVINNARTSEVAYTSFETNISFGNNIGGWAYATLAVLDGIARTPTGNKSYSLTNSSGMLSFLTINRDYILSFWAKTSEGVPVVSGAPVLQTSTSVNEWTYYQYKISQGSASPSITGPGIIDEVRLYPANAKMATTAYDPAIGKTAVCDINNRITYYEYDGLGRLVGERDEKKNLIKTYEYHYKN